MVNSSYTLTRQAKLLQHGVQRAGLELILSVADDGAFVAHDQDTVTAFAQVRAPFGMQAVRLGVLANALDELAPSHLHSIGQKCPIVNREAQNHVAKGVTHCEGLRGQVLHCHISLDRRDSWQDSFAIEYPAAIYHVTSRGNAVQAVYKDDADRLACLMTLEAAVGRFNWPCHAYCLMGNHYHLLLETPDASCTTGI